MNNVSWIGGVGDDAAQHKFLREQLAKLADKFDQEAAQAAALAAKIPHDAKFFEGQARAWHSAALGLRFTFGGLAEVERVVKQNPIVDLPTY